MALPRNLTSESKHKAWCTTFVLNMSNKQNQERRCTEPKDPAAALQLAIASVEGRRRQKTIGQHSTPTKVKEEPVFVDSAKETKKNAGDVVQEKVHGGLLESLQAPETPCNYCGIKGQFEKCCYSN